MWKRKQKLDIMDPHHMEEDEEDVKRDDLYYLIQAMRLNRPRYEWFYDHVLSIVAGRTYWKKNCDNVRGCDMSTASDETLALLLLETHWDCIIESLEHPQNASGEKVDRRKKSEKEKWVAQPKYTQHVATPGDKGWSEKGLKRYKEIYGWVVQDRRINGAEFDDWYKKKKQESGGGSGRERSAPSNFAIARQTKVQDELSECSDEEPDPKRRRLNNENGDSEDDSNENK